MTARIGPGLRILISGIVLSLILSSCGQQAKKPAAGQVNVLAIETFLQNIAQQVAGTRLTVDSLIPVSVDPHSFEPTPRDVAKVMKAALLIVNGAGLESFLGQLLKNTGGDRIVVEASARLTPRIARPGETKPDEDTDPHFWLDPVSALQYAENIRDGLSKADPQGADQYAANAKAYEEKLRELDRWIADQVKKVPEERRRLVTNHESFGYFADRYGFTITGTVIPSVHAEASPSAQQISRLIDRMKSSGVRAIFLETGSNPQLARQIAAEAGITVVTELYTHSLTGRDGPAPSYIEMMRYNTRTIVEALR